MEVSERKDELENRTAKIIAKRIKEGCPRCGSKWTQVEMDANFPALGVACDGCHGDEI